jgi:hypothetical protein
MYRSPSYYILSIYTTSAMVALEVVEVQVGVEVVQVN